MYGLYGIEFGKFVCMFQVRDFAIKVKLMYDTHTSCDPAQYIFAGRNLGRFGHVELVVMLGLKIGYKLLEAPFSEWNP